MTRLILTLFATLLSGCAATSYDMVKIDSRMPEIEFSSKDNPRKHLNLCANIDKGQLKPGQSCLSLIRAKCFYSKTFLRVNPSEIYLFKFLDNQAWYDASRRNTDANGEKGSGIMDLAKFNKRNDTESQWFFLTPVVIESTLDDKDDGRRGSECDRSDTSREISPQWPEHQNWANDSSFQSMKLEIKNPTGDLAFYPNDAVFPDQPMQFYENNSGQVWIVIAREQ